jgi:hypothetical protein
VDTRVRHEVGLELSDIDVERAIETQRSSQGGNNLSNQTVQVRVGRALDIQVAAAYVVQSFLYVAKKY